MNRSTRPPADTCMVNAWNTCEMPFTRSAAPKKIAATTIEIPGQASTRMPSTSERIPVSRTDFHRCGKEGRARVGFHGGSLPQSVSMTGGQRIHRRKA